MGLHAWSISYCDATRSDGFIPTGAWPALPGVNQARARLESAGLWAVAPGGYLLHDYTDYNRTRAQIESQQADDRVRKRPGFRPESNGIPRAPGPGPGPGPGNIPVPVPVEPPLPPFGKGGRSRRRSKRVEFDDDSPRYEQRVGADGKREWVEVEA